MLIIAFLDCEKLIHIFLLLVSVVVSVTRKINAIFCLISAFTLQVRIYRGRPHQEDHRALPQSHEGR